MRKNIPKLCKICKIDISLRGKKAIYCKECAYNQRIVRNRELKRRCNV